MNIKKTSVITLIALLSCDTFAASSIVRAGVTPLGQSTGVRATPSAGNSTNRASLGIGSYYDINKLRPNRTQTSAGGSTGGSTGGSSNNVSNSALESVRQELTQELTEVKTTLTKQISDLVKLVEAKDAEIQNLQNELDEATAEIEQIADKKYVTESDLGNKFKEIKEEAVSRALSAVNNSSYATGSYVDQEINDLRSEITSARNAALESYAKKDTVKADIATAKQAAIDAAAANVAAQEYISAATVTQDINTAKNAAIADAVDQAKLAVQNTLMETYATKDYVDNADSSTLKTIENEGYLTQTELDALEQKITTARTDDLKNYATNTALTNLETTITTARTNDLKDYATNTALTNLETTITTARNTALQDYATKDYVDTATTDLTHNGDVTSAVANLKSEITAAREAALQNYATTTALTNLKNEITSDRNAALASYAKTDTVNADIATAKQDAITDAVAQVTALDYATNKRVTKLNGEVTGSIAGLKTAIETADGELDTLAQQLGTATQNALTAEAVKGQIETALSEGKYITQSELDARADGITQSISDLDDKFATQTYVKENFAAASVITQIQSDIIELGADVAANTTGLETKQTALDSLNTELDKAQTDITNLQTGASGAITLANVNTAIETALAKKTYATSADLDQRVSDIQGWVYAQGYATSEDVGTDITLVRTDIDNKLEGYAKAETVNSLKTQLDTTDENIKNLTERTDKLASDAEDYVTNDALDEKLGNYAKTESQGQYVTRAEIETAFKVPYGSGDNTKPLVIPGSDGRLTFDKDSFDAAVTGVENVANMQGLYNWFIGTGTSDSGWFKKEDDVFTLNTGADQGFAKSVVGVDLSENATITSLGNTYATKTEFNNLVKKFEPVENWVKETAAGDSYELNNGAIAESIAGLKMSDLNDTATGEDALFAQTTAVNQLSNTVTAQEERVKTLESADGLTTILTTENEGKVPLLDMLTTAAIKSENTDALLLRALTTNDEDSKQPLLSNALVFEVCETDNDKVPLVLSLKKEDETILASQTDYTKLSSQYTTLNGNYGTLNQTVGSLYGENKLFTLDEDTKALSLNTTVFSDKMADAITTAKRGDVNEGVCSTDFKANELTEALSLESCRTTEKGESSDSGEKQQ